MQGCRIRWRAGVLGPLSPWILADQLNLSQREGGGQIMPTSLLFTGPPDFQTFLRPWYVLSEVSDTCFYPLNSIEPLFSISFMRILTYLFLVFLTSNTWETEKGPMWIITLIVIHNLSSFGICITHPSDVFCLQVFLFDHTFQKDKHVTSFH